ncbi:MAG: hypothetical protein VB111_10475 [Clostridiaceae bacterium]|nr:hypothetical protein [Clostridiaceae bacterium]
MKKTRILALALSALLIVALFAGCTNGTPSATTTAATTAAATTTAATTTTKAAATTTAAAATTTAAATTAPSTGSSEPPTVITFGENLNFQQQPCMWYETEIYKQILEMANVTIDSYYLDGDKYALALASGDLQDVMYAADSSKIREIVDSQLALDLMPLAAEYCPNLLQDEYSSFVNLVKTLNGGGEKLYFLPEHVGTELTGGGVELARGYYLRWDYYKEIGAPAINNDDDFIAAMEAMVAAHPTTADGKKTYGAGISDSLNNWYYHAVFTSLKANPWTFAGYQYMQSAVTGELLNGYMDSANSAFWLSMEFFNKLWNKDLLDPDSFTMTGDELTTKYNAGMYMASLDWKNSTFYAEMCKSDPNTLAGYTNIPSPGQLVFADNPNASGWFPSFSVYIFSGSENWEAALRLYNTVFDLDVQRAVYCGFEGKYWNYVNGVPTLTDEAIAIYSGGGDKKASIGLGGDGPFVILQTSEYHTDGYLLDLFDTVEMRALGMTPLQKDVADFYKVTVPAEAGYKYVTDGLTVDWSNTYGTELLASAMTAVPTDIGRILSKCNDILYRNVADLVMAETADDFNALKDSVLAELEAADEAASWEWCLNEFTKANETLKPIMGY